MAEITAPVALLGLSVAYGSPYASYTGALAVGISFKSGDYIHGGAGRIYGTVEKKQSPANVPLRRRVRLHREVDGMLIREAWSNAVTGAYEFPDINPAIKYTTIAYDYEHNYRAEAADNLTPEVLP